LITGQVSVRTMPSTGWIAVTDRTDTVGNISGLAGIGLDQDVGAYQKLLLVA
jgi:hypothetical protein